MKRIRVNIIETDVATGEDKQIDSFVYDLPMSADDTAYVGQQVTAKLEKLSARAAALPNA